MNFAIIAAITIAIYFVSVVLNFLMIIAMVVIDPKTDEDIHTMHVNADAGAAFTLFGPIGTIVITIALIRVIFGFIAKACSGPKGKLTEVYFNFMKGKTK